MAILPRRLRELRDEHALEQQDREAYAKLVDELENKPGKSSEDREQLARVSSRVEQCDKRITRLAKVIADEEGRYTAAGSVQARKEQRQAVKDTHRKAVARHAERASQLAEAFALLGNVMADHREGFKTYSLAVEESVRNLCESDPAQFNRVLDHVVPALRGYDQGFLEAFGAAISYLKEAAAYGHECRKPDLERLFTRAAAQSTAQLDMRLPAIHSEADAPIGPKLNFTLKAPPQ